MSKAENWMEPDEMDLDDALGQAIGDAMAPERRGEKDFREGVGERLDADVERPFHVSALARNAAAFLPPVLLPKGLVKGGAIVGGVAVKKVGWKLIPGVIAFPAVVMIMLVVTFAMGLRRTVTSGPQGLERRDAKDEIRAWWRRFLIPICLSIVALIWFGQKAPVQAIMLLGVLSMAALVGIFGALSRAGLVSRRQVGYRLGSFLFGLVIYSFILSTSRDVQYIGERWVWGVPASFAIAATLCTVLGARDDAGGREMRRAWITGVVGFGLTVGLLFIGTRSEQPVTREQALEYVEGGFRERSDFKYEVQDLASTARHLALDGGTAPILHVFQEELWSWIDREPHFGKNLVFAMGVEHLGLLRPKDYEALERSIHQSPQSPLPRYFRRSKQAIRIFTEIRGEPLTEADRDRLMGEVYGNVRGAGDVGALEDVYYRIRILDRIGRSDAVGSLRSHVEAVLLETWAPDDRGWQACFLPGATSKVLDWYWPYPLDYLHGWPRSTDHALSLMARFGVPEGIDLRLLHSYLDAQSRFHGLSPVFGQYSRAAAMRSRLESLPEWSQYAGLHSAFNVLDFRLFIAGLLLSTFCVFVTLRAPLTVLALSRTGDVPPADGPDREC